MPLITIPGGIALEYETHGSGSDPPVLMVMGFASQLVAWPRDFCAQLAQGGRHVISFDNRDCGLSEKLDGIDARVGEVSAAASAGNFEMARALAPYTLADMAADGFGLLTALGIEQAHIVGVSMGGMIVQTMAIEHPERVLTLTSMMSTTGEPAYGQSTPEALQGLLAPAASDRDGYIASADIWALWRSKRYPELDQARAIAAESFDRCYYPEGAKRHLAAVVASPPRTSGLARLRVPTLVIHGLDDTLIAPSGGERTAELVPDAQLLLIEDMGHDRPSPLRPRICQAILEHTAAAA
ncbi:MAG TPA: alpha/beta hydrolase [Solirubrobacteraceae bacterium]|jgi:pimeloyl-ACP methyl ester carboxylesterase|nr:alpha/beta hydrolase [Solirubrobacteraceae bacterium]